jgi:hypothetical protein
MNDKVTAIDIKKALAISHEKDFFATECKNGPTYNPVPGGLLIFDAISITKSWTSPMIRVYEVKVSRSDFQRDGKYQCYLPYCHEFYFVVPKGMVKKEEVPDGIGLIYYNPETKSLRTVKKPIYRKITVDADMLMYIIMNKLDSDRLPFYRNRSEYAKAYLEDVDDRKSIGRLLGSKMAKELSAANQRLERLSVPQQREGLFKEIVSVLDKHGIPTWSEHRIPKELDEALSKSYPQELDQLFRSIEVLQNTAQRIKEQTKLKEEEIL